MIPRISITISVLSLMMLSQLHGADKDGVIGIDEAKELAQQEMAKLIPAAGNVESVVYERDTTPGRTRVIFDMYFPDGVWAREGRPEAYVNRYTGKVMISVWRDDQPENLPDPQVIQQRFMFPPGTAQGA